MEQSGGFAIGTYDQNLIESNAEEDFGLKYGHPKARQEAIQLGLINPKGNITPKGWDLLNKDMDRLESNSLAWLRKHFQSVSDQGHSGNELVGSFWFDDENPDQAEIIEMGTAERIDMSDSSYGSLANYVWKGVSDFGASVLGGAISFFDIDKDVLERVEETADRAARARRKRR